MAFAVLSVSRSWLGRIQEKLQHHEGNNAKELMKANTENIAMRRQHQCGN